MTDPCRNCGNPDADLYSFDLDLPHIRLCKICALAITADRELFNELGRRHTRRRKP